MPIVAATLEAAIALTNDRVALENKVGGLVVTTLTAYNIAFGGTAPPAFPPIFNPDNQAERTVRNWFVQLVLTQNTVPATGFIGPEDRQKIVDVVCRSMFAAIDAEAAGRISTAQRDAVLAGWNFSFGAVP